MVSQADLVEIGKKYLYPNYRQPPIVLSRGEGAVVWDAAGKRYLDMYAGIAVSTLGHGHPRLAQAIADQAQKLLHVSNYFFNEPNVLLAQKLCQLAAMDRVFFCNSGTEAIEASLKLARRHFFSQEQTERFRVIAFTNSFHGRTLGALAATGQSKYRDGFGPLPGVTHVAYGDASEVKAVMAADVAAIIFEPVQGEGGVLPAPKGFIRALRDIADEHGALLIADEVQTGVGRTGSFLACQSEGVQPDIVALAKALGGGMPIGAMLCRESLSGALPPGSHGSTFGGNPLASRAALAILESIEAESLMQVAQTLGAELGNMLEQVAREFPKLVECARGRGLLQALVLREGVDARSVMVTLQDRGVLLTIAGGQALRFSPPLTVKRAELEEAVTIVRETLKTFSA